MRSFYANSVVPLLMVCCCACRQPMTKVKPPIDKMNLLEFVKKLALIETRTPGGGIRYIRSYTQNYDLIIIDSATKQVKPSSVKVHINLSKEFSYYDIDLPVALQKKMRYTDADKAYGTGIETPRPKEPSSYSVIYHVVGGGNIAVIVNSKAPPSAADPCIYQITIML